MNYYYSIKGETKGPVSGAELDRMLSAGEISPNTPVIEVGGTEWSRYSSLRGGKTTAPMPPPPAPQKSFIEKLLGLNSWLDQVLTRIFRLPSFVPKEYEGRIKAMEKLANLTGLIIWASIIIFSVGVGLEIGGESVIISLILGIIYGFMAQYMSYQLYTITNSLLIGQPVALSSSRFPRLMGTMMISVSLTVGVALLVTAEGLGGILLALCGILPCVAMIYLCMNAEGLLVTVNPAAVSPGREFNNSIKFMLRACFASLHLLTPILAVLAALSVVFVALSSGDSESARGGYEMGMSYDMMMGGGPSTAWASLITTLVLLHMPWITWLLLCVTSWLLDLLDSLFAMGSHKEK